MKSHKRENFKPSFLIFLVCLGIILAGLFKPTKLFPKQTTSSKFQVELFTGVSTLNPSDFNMFVDYDRQTQNFFYDEYYNYLRDNREISSWKKDIQGNRAKIKKAFPFGFRFKYYFNNSIGLSFGFRYLSRDQSSDFTYSYTRTEGKYTFIDKKEYSPYSLSIKGYTPMIGIHYEKKIKNSFGLEAFLTGGPLFVKCAYRAIWSSEWLYQGSNYTYPMYMSSGFLEERGQGTGFALDLGGRINIAVIHKINLFMEVGYAYQAASKISGTGSEKTDHLTKEWEGEWGIKEENIETEWGSIVLQCPTNYWEGWLQGQRVRGFKLDLSGFQLRIGLSYRF